MAEESASAKPTSPAPGPQRRGLSGDEPAQLRHRASMNRFVAAQDAPIPNVRRRSSNFSEYSLKDVRRSFADSTDDLLLPKPGAIGHEAGHESSIWHSAPLAFALLPAVAGMMFTNGSSIVTDVMLLGLAAIFLNWSVRLPWNWYHSAQSIRKKEEYSADLRIDDESEDDNALSFSQATLDEVPENGPTEPKPNPPRRFPAHEAATDELYMHETLALLSCFLFPMLGAYLLHALRSQLTRPSEGLVSNYNLTIFLLASELRPMAHMVKLIQSRTLHLQRLVNSNPYEDETNKLELAQIAQKELAARIEELESRTFVDFTKPKPDVALNAKQSAMITTEIRRGLQPDLDALNRAVRRYEKRATIQSFQTEARLHELEGRLNDAIALAASAAKNGQSHRAFTGIIIEWAATALVLPLQAFSAMAALPFKTLMAIFNYGRGKIIGQPSGKGRKLTNGNVNGNGKYNTNGRSGDRISGSRPAKKQLLA